MVLAAPFALAAFVLFAVASLAARLATVLGR